MSGLIRLEPSQGRMRISGNLYWLFLLLPLLFLVMAIISSLPIFFLTFLLAALALSLALQRYQYGQIAAVVAETAVSAEPIAADYVDATVYEPKQSFDKPIESVPYEPEYDPFTTTKPKSGINNTEIILIIVLMALLAMGVVAAILLFG